MMRPGRVAVGVATLLSQPSLVAGASGAAPCAGVTSVGRCGPALPTRRRRARLPRRRRPRVPRQPARLVRAPAGSGRRPAWRTAAVTPGATSSSTAVVLDLRDLGEETRRGHHARTHLHRVEEPLLGLLTVARRPDDQQVERAKNDDERQHCFHGGAGPSGGVPGQIAARPPRSLPGARLVGRVEQARERRGATCGHGWSRRGEP